MISETNSDRHWHTLGIRFKGSTCRLAQRARKAWAEKEQLPSSALSDPECSPSRFNRSQRSRSVHFSWHLLLLLFPFLSFCAPLLPSSVSVWVPRQVISNDMLLSGPACILEWMNQAVHGLVKLKVPLSATKVHVALETQRSHRRADKNYNTRATGRCLKTINSSTFEKILHSSLEVGAVWTSSVQTRLIGKQHCFQKSFHPHGDTENQS